MMDRYPLPVTTPGERAEWLEQVGAGAIEAEHSPYRVADYLGWQRDGSLELRPHYQRGSVWTKRDKGFLIDSVVKGYPLPLVVLQDELHSDQPRVRRRVVDGQQRLRTLFAFIEPSILEDFNETDDFSYCPPELGRRAEPFAFGDLTPAVQNRILNTRIPAVLLDSETGEREVLEVYDRLNSTGLGLNAQELRYARREGAFAELSYELARKNQSRWTSWKLFREQDIARMREVEFTSELLLLCMNGVTKTGRREIDEAYKDAALKEGLPDQEGVVEYFSSIMGLLDDHLARPQRPDPLRMYRSKGWFYGLFALSLDRLGCLDDDLRRTRASLNGVDTEPFGRDLELLAAVSASALAEAKRENPELVRSISGSASDRSSRARRLQFLRSLL
jgi:hypothetical protein